MFLRGEFVRNVLLSMCYDGTNYHGWQIQKNALTVQEVFQNALLKILNEDVDIKGCSRTDSGVHANMYCISVKINSNIPCERLKMAMNRFLPKDIAIKNVAEVPMDFHARYSCRGKEYIYKIWNKQVRNPFLHGRAFHYWYKIDVGKLNLAAKNFIGTHDFTLRLYAHFTYVPLDVEKMQKAADYLVGEHDFKSFCSVNTVAETTVRTLYSLKVSKDGDMITIRVTGSGFLYNMVRIMVGTLLSVSMGKISPSEIKGIIEAKNRAKAGPTAVAYGLYLNKVFYDSVNFDN